MKKALWQRFCCVGPGKLWGGVWYMGRCPRRGQEKKKGLGKDKKKGGETR